MMAEPQHMNVPPFDPSLIHHTGLAGLHPLAVRSSLSIEI